MRCSRAPQFVDLHDAETRWQWWRDSPHHYASALAREIQGKYWLSDFDVRSLPLQLVDVTRVQLHQRTPNLRAFANQMCFDTVSDDAESTSFCQSD